MRLFFLLPGFVVVHAPALFPSSPLHLEQKVLGTLCGRLYLLNIAADLVSLRCTPPPSVPIIADTLRRARRSARGMKIHQQLQLSPHRISLSCPKDFVFNVEVDGGIGFDGGDILNIQATAITISIERKDKDRVC